MHDSAMPSSGLHDKQILVTRAEKYYPVLSRMVESCGAGAVSLPCLAVEEMPRSIAAGMVALEDCSDVLFTSANGVQAVAKVMRHKGWEPDDVLADKRIAAVGKKTAMALSQLGVRVDIVPQLASQDGLIEAYAARGLPADLLFFRAEEGREALNKVLSQHGVKVTTISAYRTICPTGDVSDVIARLENDDIDAVLLGSAKTALHYLHRVGSLELANRPVLVGISEKMAASARGLGLNVQLVAKEASFEAMLDALAEYFDSGS